MGHISVGHDRCKKKRGVGDREGDAARLGPLRKRPEEKEKSDPTKIFRGKEGEKGKRRGKGEKGTGNRTVVVNMRDCRSQSALPGF